MCFMFKDKYKEIERSFCLLWRLHTLGISLGYITQAEREKAKKKNRKKKKK